MELEKGFKSIKAQLINFGAKKIIEFGSFHTDNVDIYSDLDLVAVMPSTKSGKEWMNEIYQKLERNIACDIIVYNEQEFENEIRINSFLIEVLNTGEVIYEA